MPTLSKHLIVHAVITGPPGMMAVRDKNGQIVKYPVQYIYSAQSVEDELYRTNGEHVVLD